VDKAYTGNREYLCVEKWGRQSNLVEGGMRKTAATMVMVLALLAPCAALADVVVMKDGRELEGRIVGETDEAVTLRLRYGEVTVP